MEKRAEWPARGRAAVSPFPGDIVESSRVPLFSAICGWILKSFDLMIATTGRFDMVYEVA